MKSKAGPLAEEECCKPQKQAGKLLRWSAVLAGQGWQTARWGSAALSWRDAAGDLSGMCLRVCSKGVGLARS